jgi:hypothetical protein
VGDSRQELSQARQMFGPSQFVAQAFLFAALPLEGTSQVPGQEKR